jgi:hypothetical protein
MSLYAQFDDGTQEFLSSNRGWSEFGEWADGLDTDEYPQVVHLREYGWCQQLAGLKYQLHAALKWRRPANDRVAATAGTLLAILSNRTGGEVLTVTDATGPDSTEGAAN